MLEHYDLFCQVLLIDRRKFFSFGHRFELQGFNLLLQLSAERSHRFELLFLFSYLRVKSSNLLVLLVEYQHMLFCLVLHQSMLLPLISDVRLQLFKLCSDLKNFFILHCDLRNTFMFGLLNFLISGFINRLFVNLQFVHSGIYLGLKVFLGLFPDLFKLICKLLGFGFDCWFWLFFDRFKYDRLRLLFAAILTVTLVSLN